MPEFFGVKPDLITYGKTLGGGLPVGVLCGPAHLMKRWRRIAPSTSVSRAGPSTRTPW